MFVVLRMTIKIFMEIKVLGTGCARCKSLEKITRKAVEELNIHSKKTNKDYQVPLLPKA